MRTFTYPQLLLKQTAFAYNLQLLLQVFQLLFASCLLGFFLVIFLLVHVGLNCVAALVILDRNAISLY